MTHTASPQALIVIPTYNEAQNVPAIVPAVLEQVPSAHILIVDDGSPDGTGKIADDMAASEPRLHVLHRTSKDGLGRAYIAGFQWALSQATRYDVIFEFDADFSHNPSYLPEMIVVLSTTADVVVGSRYVPGGGTRNWTALRKLISRGGGLYARTVLGVHVRDLTSGFIGYRRAVLETLDLKTIDASGYGFQIEMKYRAIKQGFRVKEFPIIFADREVGQSKMSSAIFAEALKLVWKLRLNL